MISLGISVLILLAQTPSPAECQLPSLGGPFHSVERRSCNVRPYGPFIQKVAGTSKSVALTPAVPFGSKFLAVIASNIGTFSQTNPAGILLSSDPKKTPKIVTDDSWRCQGFTPNSISRKDWLTSPAAQGILKNICLLNKSVKPAATLSSGNYLFKPNRFPVNDISLDAQLIWAAPLIPKSMKIPEYVICLRQLRGGIQKSG